jgi:hypothetical protein
MCTEFSSLDVRVNDNCKHVYTLIISPLNNTVHRTDHFKYLIGSIDLSTSSQELC